MYVAGQPERETEAPCAPLLGQKLCVLGVHEQHKLPLLHLGFHRRRCLLCGQCAPATLLQHF